MKNVAQIIGVSATCLVLILTSCKSNKPSNETAEMPEDGDIQKVIVDPSVDINQANAHFSITDMTIDGDVLSVALNYSGGCKDHKFTCYSTGNYAKSIPPQLTLWLHHQNNDDMCRQLLVDTLKFDVSPVRYPGQEEIIIRMNNTKKTVRYTYKN